MSKFKTYSSDNKLFVFYIKYTNLFYYSYFVFYALALISINKIFIDFVGNYFIAIALFVVFLLVALYLNKKQKNIYNELESNGELQLLTNKLTYTTETESESFDKEDIKKIKLLKKMGKRIEKHKGQFQFVRIEKKDNTSKEILVQSISTDTKPFELDETLKFFSNLNKITLETK